MVPVTSEIDATKGELLVTGQEEVLDTPVAHLFQSIAMRSFRFNPRAIFIQLLFVLQKVHIKSRIFRHWFEADLEALVTIVRLFDSIIVTKIFVR